MSDYDLDFMHEVSSTPRGKGILLCIQCGRCSSSCPVARIEPKHNPRRLMEMLILGLRSEVLPNGLPWFCLSCFTCLDKCPQGGDVGEVMFALRNLAVTEGNVPEGVLTQARNLLETGCVVNPSRMVLKQREKYGLPRQTSTAKEDVQKILSKTEFKRKIGSG